MTEVIERLEAIEKQLALLRTATLARPGSEAMRFDLSRAQPRVTATETIRTAAIECARDRDAFLKAARFSTMQDVLQRYGQPDVAYPMKDGRSNWDYDLGDHALSFRFAWGRVYYTRATVPNE